MYPGVDCSNWKKIRQCNHFLLKHLPDRTQGKMSTWLDGPTGVGLSKAIDGSYHGPSTNRNAQETLLET